MIKAGSIVGNRYTVVKQISFGGTSRIWLSKDNVDGSEWLIKEINKEQNVLGTIEKDILMKFHHPSIPKVRSTEEDEGYLYIVMEYFKGALLSGYIKMHSPIEEKLAVEWILDIAELLMYFHTRNTPLIYRDLKPDNLIVTNKGKLKLIDFGSAVILRDNKSVSDTSPVGTVGFASPEHFSGKVDNKSDIYSLGMTAYNILTSITPKRDEKLISLEILRPDIDIKLVRIIEKCLKENAEDRYQSMSEVIEDLLSLGNKKEKVSIITACVILIALILTILLISLVILKRMDFFLDTTISIPRLP